MSYLEFLLAFLGIPLCFFIPYYKISKLDYKKEFFWGIVVLIFLAVSYTTPWDNYLRGNLKAMSENEKKGAGI